MRASIPFDEHLTVLTVTLALFLVSLQAHAQKRGSGADRPAAVRGPANVTTSGKSDSDFDGVPDTQDPDPLVCAVPEITWTVSSMTFGWETEALKEIRDRSENTKLNEAIKTLDLNRQAAVKLYGEAEAGVSAEVEAQGTTSFNPIAVLGSRISYRARANMSAKLGISGSAELDWRKGNKKRAQRLNTVMQAVSSRSTRSRPFVEFTVVFLNTGSAGYDCTELEVPVMIGGDVVAYARCQETAAKSDFSIPARRPGGVPVRFRAPMDNSSALRLLDFLENQGPSVRIENSRGRIVSQSTGVDVISFLQMASQNTSALSIRRGDAPPVTWRVARSSPSGPVTLQQAMEAINALVRKAQGSDIPVFRITDGVLDSMAGVDNGPGRWWKLSVDGQDVELDLSRNLGRRVTLSLGSKLSVSSRYVDAIRISAKDGVALHQYFLGVCYFYGTGVPKDESEAVKWYRKAAEQGNALAQVSLCACYAEGTGVPKDEVEAVKWYRKAAEQGDDRAQWRLGRCYYYGTGVPKDEVEAVKWYRKAAEQDYALAQNSLGICYQRGTGVPKDEVEAVKWYRKAAEQDYVYARYNLGACYAWGTGVLKDEVEAVKWYRKAAEQGDARGQRTLGWCYASGTGVPKDEAEAVKWYRKAAEQGDAGAQNILGICYYYGSEVPKDEVEAVKWYRKAAEQGDDRAQYSLGACYAEGTGVPTDWAKAVKWYQQAAEQGNALAQRNLGFCCEYGTGVPKDKGESVKWFRKAAEQGNDEAKAALERLKLDLPTW